MITAFYPAKTETIWHIGKKEIGIASIPWSYLCA
jgi:hypothetical protein